MQRLAVIATLAGVAALIAAAPAASAAAAAAAAAGVTETPHGFVFAPSAPAADGASIVVEVASNTSFRLGVRFQGVSFAPIDSPSLSADLKPAPFTRVAWGGMTGVQTAFGSLLASTDGRWALQDDSNATVLSSGGVPTYGAPIANVSDGGVALPVAGAAANMGPGQQCLGNGQFGPPFYYNRDAAYLSFAVAGIQYDLLHVHCYPTSFNGAEHDDYVDGTVDTAASAAANDAVVALDVSVGPGASNDTCAPGVRHNNSDATDANRSPTYPNGAKVADLPACCALCNKDDKCVAWIFADPSHPDPSGSNCWPLAGSKGTYSRGGRTYGGYVPPPPPKPPTHPNAWWSAGPAADWYLAPSLHGGGFEFSRALFELTGAPAMPPRYGLAFMATYWGYDNMLEVEGNMTLFRKGEYPIDSFIMDYDWWMGKEPDLDFGYAPSFWDNNTYVHAGMPWSPITCIGAAENLKHFHEDLHMRWGGIRKPRTYSNVDMCKQKGWLLPDSDNVGAGNNNFNFSTSLTEFRDWYRDGHRHFLQDGIDYWWNDEGETQWFTYLWWNQVQSEEFAAERPGKRYFTLNRAFQPGMQRFPAITWTGDAQNCSHAYALQFITSGQPFVACDMTSPDATVLVRQYQNAVFLPIMRVHQMKHTPRFPFLWGGEEHQAGFRAALNLRYAFLPHLYSLAFAQFSQGRPMAHPASWTFTDPSEYPYSMGDAVYMVGDNIVPAVVNTAPGNTAGPPVAGENTTVTALPPGTWYPFNSTSSVQGNQTLTRENVPLTENVVHIRAGAILTLQRDIVQYSDLIGGALEVHVYAGRDGAFTMVEDDGTTMEYLVDTTAATRVTQWTWNDAKRTLTWSVSGGYTSGPNLYATVTPMLFEAGQPEPIAHAETNLGTSGSVTFAS